MSGLPRGNKLACLSFSNFNDATVLVMQLEGVLMLKIENKTQGVFLGMFAALLFLSVVLVPRAAEAEESIQQLYQAGRYPEVIAAVSGGKQNTGLESLYLGLSHLRTGNTMKAIEAWQGYVRLEKGSEGGRKISQYLTLLLQQEAQRLAKERIQQEQALSGKLDPKAIAVYPFSNKGTVAFAPLSRGLAAMIVTDLAQVKGLTVVERIHIQAILDELKLAKSGLVDPKSAPRIGKLVGAAKFTTGSFLDVDQKEIRLDAIVMQTESGKQVSARNSAGSLEEFYKIEKALVFKLLCDLGYCPESLDSDTRKAVETIHTKNLNAFQHYSQGLVAFDAEDYRAARRGFVLALEEDPMFELARKALLDTPIVSLKTNEIISGAESLGQGVKFDFPVAALVAAAPPIQRTPAPVKPEISQQPAGVTSAAAATVQVQVQVNFPIDIPIDN